MSDSGLEELLRLIYPGDVTHIMDGGSYYKSLRAHFLIDAALCSCLLDKKLADNELGKELHKQMCYRKTWRKLPR